MHLLRLDSRNRESQGRNFLLFQKLELELRELLISRETLILVRKISRFPHIELQSLRPLAVEVLHGYKNSKQF